MKYTTARPQFRNSRTFVANLLALLLLASQLAPLAAAQGARAGERGRQPEKAKGEPADKGGRAGGEKVILPAPQAVAITATKTDNVPQATEVSPGATINYTVTITNNGTDPATGVAFNDTPGANTTLVNGSISTQPIANPDAYNVIGNVRIQPNATQGLLANDTDPDTGNSTGLTASGPTTGPANGQATVNADGSFSYNPNPGYNGSDSFTYTVTDGQGKTDTATATLTVSTPIWFVDDSAAAGGDGRLTSPFNCYTGADVPAVSTCFSNTTADEAGDSIFLYDGNYTGGHTLLNNQKLVGQGASASLASIHGVTVEPYSNALPATDGTPAEVVITTLVPSTNAVNLAQGNTLRGFTVGNTTGAKIFGNNFGTLRAGDTTTPDVVLNGSGQAINLTNGTFDAASRFVSVATTSAVGADGITLASVGGTVNFGSTDISGAGAQGIDISASAVNAAFGPTSVSATAQGVLIGTSTGNITFGATTVTGGSDGVSLQNNSGGSRTFASLTRTGGSGAGFLHANGGGATTVSGATSITNAGGAGIQISQANAAVSFAGTTVTTPTGTGIAISQGAAGGNVSFGATGVDKGATAGTAVSVTNNTGRTTTFSSLDINSTNAAGIGLLATTAGNVNVTNAAGSEIVAPQAIDVNVAALGLNLTQISSTNGPAAVPAVRIIGASGALVSGTTNVQNPGNFGLNIDGNSAAFNFGNTTVNGSAGTGVFLNANTAALTFADLDISPDANQPALHATNNAATATITTTSGDIITNNSVALDIAGASTAARTPLAMALTLVNVPNSASASGGVNLNFVSGSLSVNNPAGTDTNVDNSGTFGIQVRNSTAAINFGDTDVTSSAGTGVVLGTASNGNTGNITFGDLDIAPDSGQRALHAVQNAGTLTTTSGTLAAVNGTAVEIVGTSAGSRTPLNMVLTSVSATASGGNPANGIVLTHTNGPGASVGFSVVGDNSNTARGGNATGGTIANTAGATGAASGIGVRLENADEVALRRMQINDHPNFAIYALNCANVTVAFTTISGANGSNDGVAGTFFTDEAAVLFANMTGAALVDRTKISGGIENNMTVVNDTGTLNRLVIDDSEFGLNNTTLGADSLLVVASGLAANPASTVNLTIEDSDFLGARGDVIQTDFRENGKLDLIMERNELSNAHTNSLGGGATFAGDGNALTGGTPNFTYNIGGTTLANGNTFRGSVGTAVAIDMGRGVTTGRFRNNVIGVQAIANSGASAVGGGGFFYGVDPGGTNTVLIDANQIFQYNNHGMSLQVGDLQGIATNTNMTVTNNLVSTPGTTTATNFNAIHLNHGTVDAPADTTTSCVDILSNNVAAGAKGTVLPNSVDIRLRQRQATTVRLPGYAGANNDNTAVANYLVGRNTTRAQPNGAAAANTVGGVPAGGGFIGGAACTQPSNAPAVMGGGDEPPPAEGQAAAAPQAVFAPAFGPTYAPHVGDAVVTPAARAATTDAAASVGVTAKPDKATSAKPAGKDNSLEKGEKPGNKRILLPQDHNGTVHVQIGTLGAGDSVQITFSVTVNTPFPSGTPSVQNQGTVSGTNFANVLTDDPDSAAPNDPTVTLVAAPPDISVKDASTNEPASGSKDMAFTVVLSSPAPAGGVTVNFATADQTPPGAGKAVAGVDYTATSGQLTFAQGQQVQTISVPVLADGDPNAEEGDETFLVNLSTPVNGNILDGTATGTIKAANPPGAVLISEIRTSGPAGLEDDFVELYNNSDAAVNVPAGGWGLFKMGATCADTPVLIATIPAATVIPARGHYLIAGTQYSLTAVAGNDQGFAVPLGEDKNVGLFSTADVENLSTSTLLDAVGFVGNTTNNCDLLREGSGLPAAGVNNTEYSFVRNMTTGQPLDRNDNASDFLLVSTTPATPVGGASPRLGAPGPERSTSPVNRSNSIKSSLVDMCVASSAPPNRDRNNTAVTNGSQGTLSIRRKFTNTTGGDVTQLRFRIIDVTTTPTGPGQADLRALSSSDVSVAINPACGGGNVTVRGLTLDPPSQPSGGGWNSTLSAGTVTLAQPLAANASINVNFVLGVEQTGNFRFFVIVEALPNGPPFVANPAGKGAGDAAIKGVGREAGKDNQQPQQ